LKIWSGYGEYKDVTLLGDEANIFRYHISYKFPMNSFLRLTLPALLVIGCSSPDAPLRLHALFSDHMVLQRDASVPIWGWAEPGAAVTVSPAWGDAVEVDADETGRWSVSIQTPDAGGPTTMTVATSDTTITIQDIVFGEVWVGSGQSNMEMPLSGWPPNDPIDDSETAIASANFPMIRMFTVERTVSLTPKDDVNGTWIVASPESAPGFSATAYFFAKALHAKLDVPIGIIHTSWGGTPAEAWVPPTDLVKVPGFETVNEQFANAEAEMAAFQAWVSQLDLVTDSVNASLSFGDDSFSAFEFDDSAWKTMPVPQSLEQTLPAFDGAIWYRTEVDVNVDVSAGGWSLYLGPVDDIDATYLNGVKIGGYETDGHWQTVREYPIPAGSLKPGKNVIAVRMIDLRGGGGFYGGDAPELRHTRNRIPLGGDWRYLPVAMVADGGFRVFGDGPKSYESTPKAGLALSSNSPSMLFNGMIAPILPYAVKGVIWYQGESNVGRGKQYETLFPTLIRSWRSQWGLGDFPFYFVQIAPFKYGESEPGPAAELREAQRLTLSLPNTGMVVTSDIGNPTNIHPANKKDVGERLARWALSRTYGQELVYSGPLADRAEFSGRQVTVHFLHAGSGLVAKGGPLTDFELAGADGVFHPARAVISGETVVVSSIKVPQPVTIRFGWREAAQPNLFNKEGLPASSFILR
jgi:sialate O-acetylesterase